MIKIGGIENPHKRQSPKRRDAAPHDCESLWDFLNRLGRKTETGWTGEEIGQKHRRDIDRKINELADAVAEISLGVDEGHRIDREARIAAVREAAQKGPAEWLNACIEHYGVDEVGEVDVVRTEAPKIPKSLAQVGRQEGDPEPQNGALSLDADTMAHIHETYADEIKIADDHDERLFRVEQLAIRLLNGGVVKACTVNRDKGERYWINADFWLSHDGAKAVRENRKTDRGTHTMSRYGTSRTVYVQDPEKAIRDIARDEPAAAANDSFLSIVKTKSPGQSDIDALRKEATGFKDAMLAERKTRQGVQKENEQLRAEIAELREAAEKRSDPPRSRGGRPQVHDWEGCFGHLVGIAEIDGLPTTRAGAAEIAEKWFMDRDVEPPAFDTITRKLRKHNIPRVAEDSLEDPAR